MELLRDLRESWGEPEARSMIHDSRAKEADGAD